MFSVLCGVHSQKFHPVWWLRSQCQQGRDFHNNKVLLIWKHANSKEPRYKQISHSSFLSQGRCSCKQEVRAQNAILWVKKFVDFFQHVIGLTLFTNFMSLLLHLFIFPYLSIKDHLYFSALAFFDASCWCTYGARIPRVYYSTASKEWFLK